MMVLVASMVLPMSQLDVVGASRLLVPKDGHFGAEGDNERIPKGLPTKRAIL